MGSAVSCSKDSRSKQELDKHPHPQLHCVSDTGVPNRFHYVLQNVTILQTTSHWAWLDSRCASFPLKVQEGTGSLRFVSVLDFFSKINRFWAGSVRKNVFPGSTRFGLLFRTHRGSVRFGSVRFRVRFRPVPEFNGSVRIGRFGSVRFLMITVELETNAKVMIHATGGL